MNRCEDYPCCGHTDGLGCNYTPDMDFINTHAACDHELGDCQVINQDNEDDWCGQCGKHMNYSFGTEGIDYIWAYVPMSVWVHGVGWDEGHATEYRYDVRHIDCFPAGTSLDPETAQLLEAS